MRPQFPTLATVLTLGAAIGLLLTGCTTDDADAPRPTVKVSAPTSAGQVTPDDVALPIGEPETIVTGLDAPWSIVFTSAGTPLVDERDTRRILEIGDDGSTREIGIVDGDSRGEGGLLGLALDEQNRLYAYSTSQGENRIDRFTLSGAPGSYELGAPETIIEGIPAANFHNGGRIAFGPDGMLYVTSGDAGDREAAQNIDSLNGKILRMTPEGEVPADNPFPGSLVYSFGHRNPQGIAWADDGTMFASEFGQDTWDELNIIVPGGNYGWPSAEGSGYSDRGFIDPVQQWTPDDASPSGIALVSGTVFIAALRGERLIAAPTSAPSTSEVFVDDLGRLRDVAAAPDGTLWILTNNSDGRGAPHHGDDRIVSVPIG